MLQPHIKCSTGDVAEIVLLPGDPARAKKIAAYFDNPREVAFNREFLTITGTYHGVPISVTSTGIGGASASIAVEELANIGAKTFIRVGTCGALRKGIDVGDIIIPYAATRSEGTTREYLPVEFPAVVNFEVFSKLVEAAKKEKARYHTGVNRSHDAFYENISNMLKWAEIYKDPRFKPENMPLISSEMEAGPVFITAMVRGLRAGALMVVNTVEPLDEIAKNPDLIYQLDEAKDTTDNVDTAIKIALEAAVSLI